MKISLEIVIVEKWIKNISCLKILIIENWFENVNYKKVLIKIDLKIWIIKNCNC